MKHVQFRKVLLVLVVLLLAIVLATSSPALAAKGGNDKGHAYGYGSGNGSGCGDKSESASATGNANKHTASADAARTDGSFLNPPFIAAKVYGAETGGRPFTASLSGAEEIPDPGDADGFGGAFITLNQGQGMVCWELSVSGIVTSTAAHIHQGELGVSGPVVVTLSAPEDGSSSGCASVDAELIKEIRQDPAGFYVNIPNSEFPAGALRGQLGK